MRKYINKVEIKEPPFGKSKKNNSCCSKTCLSGLGCVFFLVIASLLLIKYLQTPKNKEVKDLPKYFLDSVPLYEKNSVNKIDFSTGKNSNKIIEIVAYVPKIILYPFIMEYNNLKQPRQNKTDSFDFSKYKQNVQKPVTDQRDYYEIEWTDLPAQPDLVLEYYKTELKKQNFNIDITTETPPLHQFSFSKDNIEGVLYIKDDIIKRGTDYVLMKVKIPNPEN